MDGNVGKEDEHSHPRNPHPARQHPGRKHTYSTFIWRISNSSLLWIFYGWNDEKNTTFDGLLSIVCCAESYIERPPPTVVCVRPCSCVCMCVLVWIFNALPLTLVGIPCLEASRYTSITNNKMEMSLILFHLLLLLLLWRFVSFFSSSLGVIRFWEAPTATIGNRTKHNRTASCCSHPLYKKNLFGNACLTTMRPFSHPAKRTRICKRRYWTKIMISCCDSIGKSGDLNTFD